MPLCAKCDVLTPSQSRDIAWRKTGPPPSQLISASLNLGSPYCWLVPRAALSIFSLTPSQHHSSDEAAEIEGDNLLHSFTISDEEQLETEPAIVIYTASPSLSLTLGALGQHFFAPNKTLIRSAVFASETHNTTRHDTIFAHNRMHLIQPKNWTKMDVMKRTCRCTAWGERTRRMPRLLTGSVHEVWEWTCSSSYCSSAELHTMTDRRGSE